MGSDRFYKFKGKEFMGTVVEENEILTKKDGVLESNVGTVREEGKAWFQEIGCRGGI
jgi:hypothetical protein